MAPLLTALIPLADKVIDQFVPDTKAKDAAKSEFRTLVESNKHELETAAAGIVKTEAASRHWLAANWRPLTMLTFVGLIVARWFGWSASNMTEAEYVSIYDIIQVGLGGYVVSRGVEKIAPSVFSAFAKK